MWRSNTPLKYPAIFKSFYRQIGSNTRFNTYFDLFPKTFPKGGPPAEKFTCSLKQLRKEYRILQSEHHPDVAKVEAGDDFSSVVNRAYGILKNPYTRAAYIIERNHPQRLDISKDEVAKELIRKFQKEDPEFAIAYKSMLMEVLDAHEALEMAESESDLEDLQAENSLRLEESEKAIDKLFLEKQIDWNQVVLEAIRIKYWVNIDNGIKDWEQGKPVHLTH